MHTYVLTIDDKYAPAYGSHIMAYYPYIFGFCMALDHFSNLALFKSSSQADITATFLPNPQKHAASLLRTTAPQFKLKQNIIFCVDESGTVSTLLQ